MVFDEAHKVFTDLEYRSKFCKVKELAGFPVFKVGLPLCDPPT
jgi:hypothetical protein